MLSLLARGEAAQLSSNDEGDPPASSAIKRRMRAVSGVLIVGSCGWSTPETIARPCWRSQLGRVG